jgi:EAL domain-containing protein (putative c-di-GMP-specific phosphodiesterase class I)
MSTTSEDLVLLVDDDFSVRTAIAAALERPGRRIIVSGCPSQELRREAAARGAVAFLPKPFAIDDIEAAIGSQPDERAVASSNVIDIPDIDAILIEQRLSSAFQPIVSEGGVMIGYESLARIRSEGPLSNPTVLFQYAERKHRLLDLEMACIQSSFRSAKYVPSPLRLFVNVHPNALALGSRFTDPFLKLAQLLEVPLNRVVVEITEQAPLRDDEPTNEALAALRDSGVAFAFDDVGIAHSHYVDLQRVRPSFLKISNEFGTDFERDSTRSCIVRNIVSLAADFGIDVILEGVESEATAQAAARIGVRYMQGYWFGRPADATQLAMAAIASVN